MKNRQERLAVAVDMLREVGLFVEANRLLAPPAIVSNNVRVESASVSQENAEVYGYGGLVGHTAGRFARLPVEFVGDPRDIMPLFELYRRGYR